MIARRKSSAFPLRAHPPPSAVERPSTVRCSKRAMWQLGGQQENPGTYVPLAYWEVAMEGLAQQIRTIATRVQGFEVKRRLAKPTNPSTGRKPARERGLGRYSSRTITRSTHTHTHTPDSRIIILTAVVVILHDYHEWLAFGKCVQEYKGRYSS